MIPHLIEVLSRYSKYGNKLSNGWKIAANSALSGTAAALGGGKFANGAITGAFTILFNDLVHEKVRRTSTEYDFKRIGQVPLDENIGAQTATYGIKLTIIASTTSDGVMKVTVSGSSWNTPVDGDVNVRIQISLIANDKVVKTLSLEPHYDSYFTTPNTNFVGEAFFDPININNYDHIKLNIRGNWYVEVSPGHRNVPTYPGTLGVGTISVNETHKIK